MTTNISDIPERKLMDGISGRYVHSEQMTIGIINIDEGTSMPAHSHVHEQTTQILSGRLEMTIDGVTQILEPDSITIIPSNAVHSARALSDCVVIDTFCPVREDYRH